MPFPGASSNTTNRPGPSTLSTVVANVMQTGSTVTDEDLDKHIAELILREAKNKAEKYGQFGVNAFLRNSGLDRDPNAPRANKRFLTSIIKSTDDHNKTVLRAQALAAEEIKREREEQERRERRARAEEAAEAERLRRKGKAGIDVGKSRRAGASASSGYDWRRAGTESGDESWDRWNGRNRKMRGWGDEDEESEGVRREDQGEEEEYRDKGNRRRRPTSNSESKSGSRELERRHSSRRTKERERDDGRRSSRHRRHNYDDDEQDSKDHRSRRSSRSTSPRRRHRTDGGGDKDEERNKVKDRHYKHSSGRSRSRDHRRSHRTSRRDPDWENLEEKEQKRSRTRSVDGDASQQGIQSPASRPELSSTSVRDTQEKKEEGSSRLRSTSPASRDDRKSKRRSSQDRTTTTTTNRSPSPSPPSKRRKTSRLTPDKARPPSEAPPPLPSPSPGPPPPPPRAKSTKSGLKSHSRHHSRSPSPPPQPKSSPPPIPQPPSKMDKYFEEDYDPRLDVAPLTVPKIPATGLISDAEFAGWDAMLDLIKIRKEDKEEKRRMERMGMGKDEIRERLYGIPAPGGKDKKKSAGSKDAEARWNGEGVSIMDIEYKKKGSVREWDLGKEGIS